MICRGFRVSKFLFSSFNANKDYYKTLNVAITATPDEIKKSFRSLAKKYHPDSNKGNDDKFKQINQAYQVLSSEATKRDYDDVRRSQSQQQSRSNSSYGSSSSSSSYQNPNTSYRQQSHQYNTYRGYEQQQNWNNRSFREKTMHDIFKQQQQQFMQNHHRYTGSTMHDDNLWKRSQSSHQPNMRNYGKSRSVEDELNDAIKQAAERAKITREKVRKAYEEEEKRREEEFRKYRDSQNEKIVNELKKKMIDMAGGLKNTVEGIGRVGEFVKENVNTATKVGKMAKKLWDDYKNSKKQ